jgi:hypothetical protein
MLVDVPFLTRRGGPDTIAGRSRSGDRQLKLLIDELLYHDDGIENR